MELLENTLNWINLKVPALRRRVATRTTGKQKHWKARWRVMPNTGRSCDPDWNFPAKKVTHFHCSGVDCQLFCQLCENAKVVWIGVAKCFPAGSTCWVLYSQSGAGYSERKSPKNSWTFDCEVILVDSEITHLRILWRIRIVCLTNRCNSAW